MGCYCISYTWSFQESKSRRYKNMCVREYVKQLLSKLGWMLNLADLEPASVFSVAYQLF